MNHYRPPLAAYSPSPSPVPVLGRTRGFESAPLTPSASAHRIGAYALRSGPGASAVGATVVQRMQGAHADEEHEHHHSPAEHTAHNAVALTSTANLDLPGVDLISHHTAHNLGAAGGAIGTAAEVNAAHHAYQQGDYSAMAAHSAGAYGEAAHALHSVAHLPLALPAQGMLHAHTGYRQFNDAMAHHQQARELDEAAADPLDRMERGQTEAEITAQANEERQARNAALRSAGGEAITTGGALAGTLGYATPQTAALVMAAPTLGHMAMHPVETAQNAWTTARQAASSGYHMATHPVETAQNAASAVSHAASATSHAASRAASWLGSFIPSRRRDPRGPEDLV